LVVIDEDAIGERFRALAGELNERQRRLWAGAEALSHGWGGVAAVARATGISPLTVAKGKREVQAGATIGEGRVRASGGGRKALTETDPELLRDLERLVADESRGDPESPLRWTAKSVRHLARALREQGHEIHFTSVPKLLRALDYSMQANRKNKEGASHPDRDAQFRHINATVKAALASGEPAISVDTKKKELVGDFKKCRSGVAPEGLANRGAHPRLQGQAAGQGSIPTASLTSPPTRAGSASGSPPTPARLRPPRSAAGGSTLGLSAIRTPRLWRSPPTAASQTATAPACGRPSCRSSPTRRGYRSRSATSRPPPRSGTSRHGRPPTRERWNAIGDPQIEHRLFSFISRNWRGQPLVSRQAIVSLIGATTSSTALKVYAQLDEGTYERGIKVSDAQLATVNLTRDEFHGAWNYVITPHGCWSTLPKDRIDEHIATEGIDAPTAPRYTPVWHPGVQPRELRVTAAGVRSIVWSIGFDSDYEWVQAPIFDGRGHVCHERGETSVPGLYVVGLPWLYTWGSGRFSGIARDAEYLADLIDGARRSPTAASEGAAPQRRVLRRMAEPAGWGGFQGRR
jgi:Rhodopirellula transposase DDE domain